MRTIKIYCKTCNVELTEVLAEIQEKNLRMEDNTDAIQSGHFSVITENDRKQLIISLKEGYLFNHPDYRRFQGCCGSGGMDGYNKLCRNGHEVGTEFSDCYMPRYVELDSSKVIIKQTIDDYTYSVIVI